MSLNECQQQDWYGSEVSPDLPGPYSEAFDSLQQTAPNDKEEEALTYRDDAISFGMEFLESGERPEEVLRRIETILVQLVDGISHGFVPDLAVWRQKGRKIKLPDSTAQQCDYGVAESEPAMQGLQESLISFTAQQGASTVRYTRIISMLAVCHELVRTGRMAPQRDIYYQLKTQELFQNPQHVATAVEDIMMMLRVSRSSLGICVSSKGLVSGALSIFSSEGSEVVDCSLNVQSIPGDCQTIQAFSFHCQARCVIVIEKDSIFQRLVQEGFPATTESILITAKGMPDHATRCFVAKLATQFPGLPIFGVVDWNPSGVSILRTYKYGSQSVQGSFWTLPELTWLGVHAQHLDGLPEDAYQPLTRYDRSLMKSLRDGPVQDEPHWQEELSIMDASNVKAEIETANLWGGFGAFARVLAQDLMSKMALLTDETDESMQYPIGSQQNAVTDF